MKFEIKNRWTGGLIAAIPTATDGKFRLKRCRVVGEKDLTEIGLVKKEEVAAKAEAQK